MPAMEAAPLLDSVTWDDLTEVQPNELRTSVERANPEWLSPEQQAWREHGYLIVKGMIPSPLIDAYSTVRAKLANPAASAVEAMRAKRERADYYGGWSFPTPFMICSELRDVALYPDLMGAQMALLGIPTALNLALTGWVSTERKWHQDAYLNPWIVGNHYIAAWIALDDIHPDSGPFELVPGSHNWPVLSREKLFDIIPKSWHVSPHWPTWTQDAVARVCEEEIARRGVKPVAPALERGDVLLWSASLMHRGSMPRDPGLLRKALICHYSSVVHRIDMRQIVRHENGSLYFHLPVDGDVRPPT